MKLDKQVTLAALEARLKKLIEQRAKSDKQNWRSQIQQCHRTIREAKQRLARLERTGRPTYNYHMEDNAIKRVRQAIATLKLSSGPTITVNSKNIDDLGLY